MQIMQGNPMTATQPFTLDAYGCAIDALGHRVLVCSNFGSDCTARYSEPLIDANPAFECPICGRLGMRMEEMRRIEINSDNHIPTQAERIANHKAIMKMHRANRFRLMFGQPLLQNHDKRHCNLAQVKQPG